MRPSSLITLALFSAVSIVATSGYADELTRLGPSQNPPWEAWKLARAEAPALDVYVTPTTSKRPVVVILQGSKCYPLFSYREKNGRREIVSPLIFTAVADKELPAVYFAAVERRGITSFGDRPPERPQCTDAFGAVTKTDRVRDVADAISALRQQPWAGKIYVVGHSEGADVATGVARLLGDDAVAGVALLSGGGPTQFFDFVMEARHQKDEKRVQAMFDDMIFVTGPQADGKLNGLPIKRWKTFALESTPLDDLRGLRLPVFVAQGTLDVKASVEGADLLVLELLRNSARPVRYLMLPDSDHDFMSADGKQDQSGRVVKDFLQWVMSAKLERAVQTGFTPR